MSVGDGGDNLIVHGDNLHALKALLPRYAGRVKCVYIDPPYNTGNEGWTYNDNVSGPLMREWLERNAPVDGEDLERHDKWLCMMWPRLQLLRELLADDGVIFVSIDHNEEHHLRMLMDEIFGEDMYRNTFAVARVKKNIRERERVPALNFGYNSVLFYGKSGRSLVVPPFRFQRKDARWHAFDAPGVRANMEYELFGAKPPAGRHWMFSEERAAAMIRDGRLRPGPRSGRPQYLLEASDETMLDTDWTDLQEYDTRFDFPNGEKNVALIQRLIGMSGDPDAIVLDSFAGSGTTAHAVLALNREDGGDRRFILVECEDYADAITAERVRRVIAGVPDARDAALREGLGGSFTYCTLGDPVTVEGMLTGETLPPFASLAAWLLHTATGVAAESSALSHPGGDGLFHEDERRRCHLLYEPDLEWLRSGEAVLNEERAKRIGATARERGKEAWVFAAGKYLGQRELDEYGVVFCQLPYELHRRG